MSDPSNNPFFSSKNERMLVNVVYKDVQRRRGSDLTLKEKVALEKRVSYYMNEVYEELGNQPITVLNTEVIQIVGKDYLGYLNRNEVAKRVVGSGGGTTLEDRSRMDVGSRFSQLQTERQEARPLPPAAPDFRISLEDGASTALSLFEQVKKQREDDALRTSASAATGKPPSYNDENVMSRTRGQNLVTETVEASVTFGELSDAAKKRDELALVERSLMRQAASQKQVNLSLPPDPRAFFFGNSMPGQQQLLEGPGLAQTNPTTALPDSIRTRPVLPQDVIKKQDDIISYRENEYNLFLYSSDRDWTVNKTENRYNFSVNFDPANNRSGFGFSTAASIKFKNIVRVELVKAIVPTEGLDILATQTAAGAAGNNTDLNVNVLSFPYLMVRVPELDTNNFGTNTTLDSAFGVVQYDANWISDSTSKNRGYLAMIPKFMKCQKVYYPTPLATLQKLSIQLQRPDGSLVSDTVDTLDVKSFVFSSQISNSSYPNAYYTDTAALDYIWINTTTWFSKFMVSQGDRVVFKNIVFPTSFTPTTASTDLLNFIQRSTGHVVADVGKFTSSLYTTGANTVGYCNYIIIKNNYADPTTGSTTLAYYGGTSTTDTTLRAALSGVIMASGRLINMNHQTQVVLRVITRDMDSANRLRPDNNF